jgi:acetyltransferase-like isoleucine patch superfamily enzyme
MLKWLYRLLVTQTFWRLRLGSLGFRSVLFKPLLVSGAGRIHIGVRSQIRDLARLEVIHRPEMGWGATLRIGDRVNIEQGVHIICQCDVSIGNDVSITPYCSIVDTYHPHDPPDQGPKIGVRLPLQKSFVHIGDGSFIGTRVVILPNVRIGRCCVIGAGSVVTRDVPDYAVAVGAPARVISVFDLEDREWKNAPDLNDPRQHEA